MECTLSGAGTSHRVNSILVKKQTQVENQVINEQDELQPPTKRVCRRSIPPEVINNEIPEYYRWETNWSWRNKGATKVQR